MCFGDLHEGGAEVYVGADAPGEDGLGELGTVVVQIVDPDHQLQQAVVRGIERGDLGGSLVALLRGLYHQSVDGGRLPIQGPGGKGVKFRGNLNNFRNFSMGLNILCPNNSLIVVHL